MRRFMQIKMKKMFLYIVRMMAGLTWLRPKPGPSISNQPAEWYRTCEKLWLDRFIICLTKGDLTALTITGNPSIGDLVEAWSNIYAEYCDFNNNNEQAYLQHLQKKITLLNDHIIEVETTAYLLSILTPENIAEIRKLEKVLADREIELDLDPLKPDQYFEKLKSIDFRLAQPRLQLEIAEKELKDYLDGQESQTIDTSYFTKMLSRIARFRKVVVIRPSEITVLEFVIMVQDFMEYVKAQQKAMQPDGDPW